MASIAWDFELPVQLSTFFICMKIYTMKEMFQWPRIGSIDFTVCSHAWRFDHPYFPSLPSSNWFSVAKTKHIKKLVWARDSGRAKGPELMLCFSLAQSQGDTGHPKTRDWGGHACTICCEAIVLRHWDPTLITLSSPNHFPQATPYKHLTWFKFFLVTHRGA